LKLHDDVHKSRISDFPKSMTVIEPHRPAICRVE
jgi:hypothetical protein